MTLKKICHQAIWVDSKILRLRSCDDRIFKKKKKCNCILVSEFRICVWLSYSLLMSEADELLLSCNNDDDNDDNNNN